ncbi:MAG: type II toxin-antitoxin system VapC family toxin [Xanthomonadaceae bacterium]|nr:type II toxin-antitoxin system VapC family toxin [Xanthomonadaceae bacterium]
MKLLDTDICIHLLNALEPALVERFRLHSPAELALCSVVRAELLWGARNSQRVDENLERVRLFAAPMRSLAFDDDCAEHYDVIRAALSARGTPIGPNDTLIAAIALAADAVLVTRNQREFQRIDNLAVESW